MSAVWKDISQTPTLDLTAITAWTDRNRRINGIYRREQDEAREVDRTIPCPACDGMFATARGLSTHMAQHCPRRAA
jgi:hypothetical protein